MNDLHELNSNDKKISTMTPNNSQPKQYYEEVDVKEKLPPVGEDVLCSWDGGKTFPEECQYMENRTCMLAGVGGGNGYFGAGFATNGSTGCEKGLILDTPTHWLRPIENKEQDTLYRWVKASERLPETESKVPAKYNGKFGELRNGLYVELFAPNDYHSYKHGSIGLREIEWLEPIPPIPQPVRSELRGEEKTVDEIINMGNDIRYSENDAKLSKLGDEVLSKLKENPNHITTQLKEFNEQVSYNTGFHTGFILGYCASTPSYIEVAGKWISVETPPKKEGLYLAWVTKHELLGPPQGAFVVYYGFANDEDATEMFWSYGMANVELTHWQPLPQPPSSDNK